MNIPAGWSIIASLDENITMGDPKPELAKYDGFTEKGKKRIAEICRAAAGVFYERGYLSSTISDISAAVGKTKGGIFHYFSTKEELLFLILYRYYEYTLNKLKEDLNACNSPHEKIYTYIRSFIMGYRDKQIESRLALNERGNLPPKYLEIIKEKEKEFVSILRSLVDNLLNKKDRSKNSVTFLTYSLLGMCTWPYRWFNPQGEISPEELAQVIYQIFMGEIPIHNLAAGKTASSNRKR